VKFRVTVGGVSLSGRAAGPQAQPSASVRRHDSRLTCFVGLVYHVARSDTTTDQSMNLADQSSNYPLKNGRMDGGRSSPSPDSATAAAADRVKDLFSWPEVRADPSPPLRTARELQPSRTCWARPERQADLPLRSSCAAAQATSSPWSGGTRLVRAVTKGGRAAIRV
jgi:hypothetical protein